MDWIDAFKNFWWLFVTLIGVLAYIAQVSVSVYKYKFKLQHLENHQERMQKDVTYLLRCSFAVLDGLKQQGCNGKVTEMYDEMRKFVLTTHGED